MTSGRPDSNSKNKLYSLMYAVDRLELNGGAELQLIKAQSSTFDIKKQPNVSFGFTLIVYSPSSPSESSSASIAPFVWNS
jgi:hypothetical protein